MAIPTIISVTPSFGPAHGDNLVKVTGTNFRVLPQYSGPPVPGSLGEPAGFESPPQTVRVYVNNVVSSAVFVDSTTQLFFRPPTYTGDHDAVTHPVVNIDVFNIDDDGNPIPGESATAVGAYTYKHEPLRPPTLTIESPYVRVPRTILEMLRRTMFMESGITTHTDFSIDSVSTADAKMPSVYVMGPDVEREIVNIIGGEESIPAYDLQPDGTHLRYPPPTVHRFTFNVVGVSNSTVELLTMMGVVRKFFRVFPYLEIPGDIHDAALVRMPMVVINDPSVVAGPSDANIRVFTARFDVRHVPILSLPADLKTYNVDMLELFCERIGGVFIETLEV